MAAPIQRLDEVRRAVGAARLLGFVGILALAVIGGMLFLGLGESLSPRYLIGMGLFVLAMAAASSMIVLWRVLDLLLKVEANTFRGYDLLRDMQAALKSHDEHLRVIAESVQLSDVGRTIAHRDKERSALRLAINEEIIRGDWEAAYALVELLEARHGYKDEAMRLRLELDQSRDRDRNKELYDTADRVQRLIESRDWDRAKHEMDSVVTEHPEHPLARELPKAFAKARNDHKRQLLKEWDASVQRNEIDRGIAILKELDQYLTRNEAAALEESARGVFRAKLHNLGVQFSLAVADHNWRQAFDVGHQIIEEFPNSRMAREVREHLEALAKRADENQPTTVEPA
jgi:hypothetical protein